MTIGERIVLSSWIAVREHLAEDGIDFELPTETNGEPGYTVNLGSWTPGSGVEPQPTLREGAD